MTYETYCLGCKEKGFKPTMTKKQFDEMIGIPVSKKHESLPQIKPKPKATVNKPVKVEKAIKPKKPKAVKPPKERKHIHDRVSLKGMTPEQIKAHRSKLQCARMAKKKADGWVEPKRTPEQIEQRKKYYQKYYELKKHDPEYKARRAAANRKHDAKRLNRTIDILSA